eukprot:Mycagemm_TRINITY_DN10330_c1_g11::TRINITY_DN10330_c1_g11_i1::g.1145::m.1145 type:complete len:103 gc:universal TRINITY_DN10330_c1_g11_i1:305-613(+)
MVVRYPEDLCELLVIARHQLRLGGLLGQRHEAVDVLDGAERLLPELEIHGDVQLNEASLEMKIERLWRRERNGLLLVGRFGLEEVVTQDLSETTELRGALVL